MTKEIITGLDIGATMVRAVIAQKEDKNKVKVLGFGEARCDGLIKGEVVNIISTSEAVKTALKMAEEDAGQEAKNIIVGVSGENTKSMRTRNYVTISNDDGIVTVDDLKKLRNDLRNIPISRDDLALHILHEEFFADRQGKITRPVGVACSRLEAANYIVTAPVNSVKNLRKAIEKAGDKFSSLKLQSLAAASAVLDPNEKELGVLLIDLGAGTTDVLIYQASALRFSRVFWIAGNTISNDIKEVLRVVYEDAEKLKTEYGYAIESAIVKDVQVSVAGVGPRPTTKIPISLLMQIINGRVEELFRLIKQEIEKDEVKNKVGAGIVITGGGALLKGIADLAVKVFGLPTRIGLPLEEHFEGDIQKLDKPEYASVLGLLLPVEDDYFSKEDDEEAEKKKSDRFWNRRETKVKKPKVEKNKGSLKDFLENVKRKFDEL